MYIVITSANARDEATTDTLNTVTSSLVHRFFCIDISYMLFPDNELTLNQLSRKLTHMHFCLFHKELNERLLIAIQMCYDKWMKWMIQMRATPLNTLWDFPLSSVNMETAPSTDPGFPRIFPSISTIVSQPIIICEKTIHTDDKCRRNSRLLSSHTIVDF